jgi:molecular chaperone GrpE
VSRSADHRDEQEPVVVRDRRRIDPLTGEVRTPPGADAPGGAGPAGASGGPSGQHRGAHATATGETATEETEVEVDTREGTEQVVTDPAEQKLVELSTQLDERTADLQRVSAEYANYRRRVDRDREVVSVNARAQLAGQLLTVLDDIDRANAHGDLTGAFKAVADKLVNVAKGVGLESFGVEGDPFDPAVHEAVAHETSAEVDGPTVTVVMRQGYKIGERVLRPAMVAVTDRDPSAPPASAPGAESSVDSTAPEQGNDGKS